MTRLPNVLPEIADGFTYNTLLNYLPGWFLPHALAQMDVLRRVNNYRPRFYVVQDAGLKVPVTGAIGTYVVIPAYDTLTYQVAVTPGAYLWGYSVYVTTSALVAVSPSNIGVQITDSGTTLKMFEDFAIGTALRSDFTARSAPVLLTQPRLILEPGDIDVEITNRTGQYQNVPAVTGHPEAAEDLVVQLLLCTSEPCRLISNDQRLTSGKVVR